MIITAVGAEATNPPIGWGMATGLDPAATRLEQHAVAVARVGATTVAAVDYDSRFPAEACAAVKAEGLLGIMVPRKPGRKDATVRLLALALRRYEALVHDEMAVASPESRSGIALAKVEASKLAVAIIPAVLRSASPTNDRNDSRFTIGRFLRDMLSSLEMIKDKGTLSKPGATASLCAVLAGLREHRA